MTIRGLIAVLSHRRPELSADNRVPAGALTRFMGGQPIEQPLVREPLDRMLALFFRSRSFRGAKRSFKSLHDCFTRELRPGLVRPTLTPSIRVSPCDAIIGGTLCNRGCRTV